MKKTMTRASLYGPGVLRLEEVPIPRPAEGELLVQIEACGVCPTDIRKYTIGVHSGGYPLNPGHEWVGQVVDVGQHADGWRVGDRVYGDTYAGYAEYATLPISRAEESCGAVRIPSDLPIKRAVFLEPIADCYHAWIDGALLRAGQRVLVFGAGQMGLLLVGVASQLGAEVIAVEPLGDRRELAEEFGAVSATAPDGLADAIQATWGGAAPHAAVVSFGTREAVQQAMEHVGTGGRIVLFAGFGLANRMDVDLNEIHYRELSLVGTTWIGMPPHQQWERYDQALDLLKRGAMQTERIVTATCDFDQLEEHFERQANRAELKTIFIPGA